MNIWSTLGIKPTYDAKSMRGAYIKQAELCHREEKPEGFKRLCNAYQQSFRAAEEGGERNEETEQGNEPVCSEESYKSAEPTVTNEKAAQKTPPELDFNALFEESAEQFLQEALESSALIGIAERLRDPKRRNNKAVWKEFFFSDEYFAFHIKPGSLTLLVEYLRQQQDVPVDNLPRIFCVWLSIIAGVPDYDATGYSAKMITKVFPPIAGILDTQTYAQYNQSEINKADYDLNRLCFAMFNHFLDKYPVLREMKGTDAWVSALGSVESNVHHRAARADYCKILVFIVNNMRLPSPVLYQLFKKYEMDIIEHSSMKNDYRPLYEALICSGIKS